MADRNDIDVIGGELVIVPRGLDKVWGFRRRIVVPLEEVAGVEVEQRPHRVETGWRGPGLDAGTKLSGTFHPPGERTYWNVSGPGAALLIHVRSRKPFDRLYLSVADAEAARQRIAKAVEQFAGETREKRT
ncbi:hypothetical protein [Leucobacter aridicollis]|uniref:Uncharacterized protein n=1 Tax=Leucobacter aridicollis TaxID=283878 RepID=A0A852R4K4_9MICO|nr:hypothetical protein [Leucobacter aridicollis]MBL3681289.1 hypothetical protein [Leucobacter aridicollis]NYD27687.1 hypothetical protein [Leucobacter aridicollis]